MRIMVIGASRGLGRALVDGLAQGHELIGISRNRPADLPTGIQWIEADMSDPLQAVDDIEAQAPQHLDAIIYNLGIWETRAFEDDYSFLQDDDAQILEMVSVNIGATLLLLKRLLPRLLGGAKPQLILTGSTSALPQSGRPEVTFGASKFALKGIAETLREGFRDQRLAVTCLQLGYLNTQDGLHTPVEQAAQNGEGQLIPLHDVVALVRTLLSLSDASYVRELVLPAIADERF
ncbi:dehydrogenase [Ectopseudomonas composti]|uniref:Dehydrogenase n=1 Tax=Ectopseudomonas composti TaxID=658457 RepID=A0ABN0S9R0_9GAMM|nr:MULTISPECIES: SDR family oxidoreductase [Pseudomonas]EZH78933.1 dehydrogenase [Pseudomonas composti]QNH03927.1 SDR family oxidoreductase [Pseudomonas sp. B11D7D]